MTDDSMTTIHMIKTIISPKTLYGFWIFLVSMRIPMFYVSGKKIVPTQIADFEISQFYHRNPIFGGLLNHHTLEKDKVR
jgi:hypothetical protein